MENIKKFTEYNDVNEGKTTSKYSELDKIAEKIAKETAKSINDETKNVKSDMQYKAQYVLEEVIKILQEKV